MLAIARNGSTSKGGYPILFNSSRGSGSGLHTPHMRVHGDQQVIKLGTLRKYTAHNMGKLETTSWKMKYVELSPGKLSYSDGSSPTLLGIR